MRQHRGWSMWLAVVLMGVAMSGSLIPTAARAAPAGGSATEATTIPVVPEVLVGPRERPVQPPPVSPVIRPTPAKSGSVTYAGILPKGLKVSIAALRVMGKGDVKIEGNISSYRISGEGTFSVDKGSSISLDPDTSATITDAGTMYRFVNFSGTAHGMGANATLQVQGERLMIIAEGKGTVTMSGDGMFRLTQSGGRLVSGFFDANVTKKAFEQVTPVASPSKVAVAAKHGIPPAGLIPEKKPQERVYEIPKLPSEGGERVTTGTAPTVTPAPAPPVPGATRQ